MLNVIKVLLKGADIMKKSTSLAKYEFINLLRSKLFWIMAGIYIIGIEESIRLMHTESGLNIGLIYYFKSSWLPLNLMMFPLLLIGYKLGKDKNEIFDILNISKSQRIKGKVIPLVIISLFILLSSTIIAIIIGIISRVSFGYFMYFFGIYIINCIIFLATVCSLGLFIGTIIESKIGDLKSFILLLLVFLILTSFRSISANILPLFGAPTISSTFRWQEFDMKYFVYIIFWIGLFILINTCILLYYKFSKKIILITILGVAFICISVNIQDDYNGSYYEYISKSKYDLAKSHGFSGMDMDKFTYYSSEDLGYEVTKYDMNIIFNEHIKNTCKMNIDIFNDDVDELEFGLFNKLEVKEILIDNEKVDFDRKGNSVKIKLSSKLQMKNIEVQIIYEGNVDAVGEEKTDLFYVNNNSIFLSDVFEWYPKLNDNKEKDYILNIKYSGSNKLYTNLIQDSNGTYMGSDKEIFIVSGKITERQYKDYTLIGNEEYFKSDEQCEKILEFSKELDLDSFSDKKDIIMAPNIPGIERIKYKNTHLIQTYDTIDYLFNK